MLLMTGGSDRQVEGVEDNRIPRFFLLFTRQVRTTRTTIVPCCMSFTML